MYKELLQQVRDFRRVKQRSVLFTLKIQSDFLEI